MALADKLAPSRFSGMSGRMAAIVGAIIGETFTEPAIAELCITSDGFLMARAVDDIGFNDFIGEASDLERNWRNLLNAADLTVNERAKADELYAVRVTDWRI